MAYRVMIVDDQSIARKLFESVIEGSDKFELAKSVESASMVDVYLARYSVDLLLLDIVMPDGAGGLAAAEYVKSHYPSVKVILATSMPEVSFLDRAREIGVESFWYKEAGESLLDVMERTMAGERVFPDAVPPQKLGQTLSTELSAAELAVLRELTTGAGNQEIGERLNISVNTVKSHIQHMLEKTGYANRTELAIQARVLGVVIATG